MIIPGHYPSTLDQHPMTRKANPSAHTNAVSIVGMGLALPEHCIEQKAEAEDAIERSHLNQTQALLLKKIYRKTGVKHRHSALLGSDYHPDPSRLGTTGFYPEITAKDQAGPSIGDRMKAYQFLATELAEDACLKALRDGQTTVKEVTHVVAVSCTGMFSPGLDIQLIQRLGLASDTVRTQIGFMGCHGAFNGMRTAETIVKADPNAVVLMVCVELCTLHFHYGWDPEKIVANALFGDGAAALVVRGDQIGAAYQISDMQSQLIPDSMDEMSWTIGDHGFEMTLSAKVPELLTTHVPGWIRQWLADHDLGVDDIAHWAIHPGGPKIVESLRQSLGLDESDTAISLEVLKNHGNISSATVLSILYHLRSQIIEKHQPSGPIVAMAFGPGLVGEAMLLNV